MANIAVVDDNKFFTEAFERLVGLMDNSNILFKASNGKELLHYKNFAGIDVVFYDIKLPLADKIWTIKQALLIKPSLRIICISNYKYGKYYERVMEAGAVEWISKDDLSIPVIERMLSNVLVQGIEIKENKVFDK